MLLQKLRTRVGARLNGDSEAGFTLVELLVVMLILGLLAAIAIPSFFNQRDKAKDSEAKEAVRTAQTSMETYATDHNGSYSGADPSALRAIESTLTDVGARLTVPTAAADNYSVSVASTNTPNVFTITRNASGITTQTCTTDGNDGCPPGGNWGNG
jgi:type IV pilus assembly protein PilA